MQSHQRGLLESYDVVLTVDVDEIVAPDPAWGTLGEYLAGFQEEWVNCLGYEILHLPDREPPLDPSAPRARSEGLLVRGRRIRQARARHSARPRGRSAFTGARMAG